MSQNVVSYPDTVPGLSPHSYKVLAVAPARVYHAKLGTKHTEWAYSRLKGFLVFGMDRDAVIDESDDTLRYWFRLINGDSNKVIWAFKLPTKFEYKLDRPFFHAFQGMSRRFGFLFDDDDEAAVFSKTVLNRTSTNRVQHIRTQSMPSRSTASSLSMISAPKPNTLVHIAHVGISKEGIFETSKRIDPSWKAILAGLRGHGVTRSIVLEHIDFVDGFWKGDAFRKSDGSPEVRVR